MKKAAVTGASGHVGNVLCRALVQKGIKVNAMIHHSSESLMDVSVNKIKCNLHDSSTLDYFLEGVDTVFHAAAKISLNKKDEKEIFKINLDGTFNLLESCKRNGVSKFIYFSSIHVLDPFPKDLLLDESRLYNERSTLAYDQSKLEAEKLHSMRTILHVLSLFQQALWDHLISGRHCLVRHLSSFIKENYP